MTKSAEEIRPFRNSDLPGIAEVWLEHWSAAGEIPAVSVAMIEQAIFSRVFFQSKDLLVAQRAGKLVAWSHLLPPDETGLAIIPAVCFSPSGLPICDALLNEVESRARCQGTTRLEVGPLRDNYCGYAGLAPVGHGIGVSTADARTSSLLSRQGFCTGQSIERLMVSTSTYRPPVSRDWMQLRRTTKIDQVSRMPTDLRYASALSHFDIETFSLVDHRSAEILASVDVWMSDPEARVMSVEEAILDIGAIHERGELSVAEGFLISSLVQMMAIRRVFTIQTAIDSERTQLITQFTEVGLKSCERGYRWTKTLVA
jgi:hypothetical protein